MSADQPSGPDGSGSRPEELSASSYAGFGLQFAVGILVFLYIGKWLDERLGTAPVLTLAGVFLGGGGSFYSVYRRLMAAQKRDDERRSGH